MSVLDTAISYLHCGLCVLPAIRQEKRPALPTWKTYQARCPTVAELRQWFARDTALCILTGAVSGNLEMIDFDLEGELYEPWRKLVESEAPGLAERLVIERSQSGGYHAIYRCEQPVSGSSKFAQRVVVTPNDRSVVIKGKAYKPRRNGDRHEVVLTPIETRGEGGLFLCHPTKGYELLQGSFQSVPVVSTAERELLLEAAASLNELIPTPVKGTPPTGPRDRPGDLFNRDGDMRALLLKHGWTLARSGENEYWRRPGKDRGWSATLKDRVFYVFTANAPPFEPTQAYSPFAVYAMLEHGGDFARAATALRGQTCGPPAHALSPSQPPPEPSQEKPFEPLSVRELVARFPSLRPPVVHGLLRQGETMNVISSPKVGKSWLVTDLALSIATGRRWLGTFKCEPGDVLILDNELHGETSAHRVPRVANAHSIGMDEYGDHVFVHNLRGQLLNIYTLGSLFESIPRGRFKVIVLDAFYRFLPRDTDENDNGTMANLYNYLDLYADRLGCCFVLIHHSSKGNQSSKAVTDVGAGAGSQSRATDTHLVLRPHEEEGAVVLDAAVRSWAPVEPRCLRWSFPVWLPADELDPARLKSDSGRKNGEKKEEWSPESFAHAFVTPEPSTRSAIIGKAVRAGLSKWAADSLLRMADNDGLVTRQGGGKRSEPFTYQRGGATATEEGLL